MENRKEKNEWNQMLMFQKDKTLDRMTKKKEDKNI